MTCHLLEDYAMSQLKGYFGALAVFVIVFPCLADVPDDVPDVSTSIATIAYNGPGTPTLLVVPDGSGPYFTQAHDEDGNLVDATITLIVLDYFGIPIANYPFEDCWLESMDGGMAACYGGNTADYDTDINGVTQWVNPMRAGGYSEALVRVMINGSALTSNAGLPLKFNSPDINVDGIVNLIDVAIVTQDYFTGYNFRCDLNGDGVLDLRDVPPLAQYLGAQCP